MRTMLDEVLSAVDAGAAPPPAALERWAHRLSDPATAAAELTQVRQRLVALRPAASAQIEVILSAVLAHAVHVLTQRAVDDALNDCVTGLPTRRLFERDCRRALAAAARAGRPVSVVMVDVDGLKKINDTHGHAAGDAHLHAVAQALRAVVREGDGAYRVGGDEFVVLLADADRATADLVMRRYAGPPASWGIATADGPEGDADGLLEAADAAMYRVRRQRRRGQAAPVRPRSRSFVLGVAATALATLSTAALVTVTAGSSLPDQPPAPARAAPAAPASPPAPASPLAPPAVVAVAPAPLLQTPSPVAALPVTLPPALPSPSPSPVLVPVPVPVPSAPALPVPAPDPGVVPVVVEETVTLLEETVCSLLC